MRTEIIEMAGKTWARTIGSPRCQQCKYGVMHTDESYDVDDCVAVNTLYCPAVMDQLDDTCHWLEVCMVELEWVKRENK